MSIELQIVQWAGMRQRYTAYFAKGRIFLRFSVEGKTSILRSFIAKGRWYVLGTSRARRAQKIRVDRSETELAKFNKLYEKIMGKPAS